MPQTLTIFLATMFCLSVLACFQPGEPETITFLDGTYQTLKPATWSMLSDLNDSADLEMGNLSKEAYCTVLSEAKVDFAEDITLEKFGELTRPSLVQGLSSAKLSEPKSLTVNGQRAILYEITGSMESLRIKYWHIVLESPDHFHQILMWSLPSMFEKNQPDFQSVLDNFRPSANK